MPHSPNVSPSATAMTLQVCSYNSATDTATVVFDLNDHTTTYLHNRSLSIKQPKEIETRSGNMQTQGEIVPALQYANRHITMKIMVRGASSAAVEASVAALINAVKSPALPYCLALAWPGMSVYRYADVVRCVYSVPTDPQEIQGLICRNIALDFECRPGLRADRVTLQNLLMNPGFEGPMGGGVATSAPVAFSDTFANVNAYTVVAGGAPSVNPANTYVDIIHADAPLRHYRLGESSGTSVYDIGGTYQTGTATNAPTQGVAGGISGDTDTCYTFAAASSQAVSLPNTGLPTGNAAISLECWFKFAANPAGSQSLIGYGKNVSTAHQDMYLYIDSSGRLNVDFQTGASVQSTAVTTGAWHHAVATWDGTTLRLYLDGASVGTPITPGAQSIPSTGAVCNIAALATGGNNYSGQIDEVAIYGAALSAAQVTAHYTAGHTGATGTVASAMSLPAAGQVKFGSPVWGAIQNWQTRFRFVTGLTNASWYLHYTDANNYVRVWLSGTTLNLEQKVAGATTALHSAVTLALVHEAWYWLQITQFPASPSGSPYLQALLLSDNAGAVGTQIASIAGLPAVGAPAIGQPQLAATGAALTLGGAFTNTHAVSLFGPGAWSFASSGTGAAAGAWDGAPLGALVAGANSANPYSGGPVTSFGCARVDAAPAGALNAQWQSATALTTTAVPQSAAPISAAGNTLGASAWVKTSAGLPGTLTLSLQINEYNSGGAFLRTGSVSGGSASATGAQTAWTQLSGTYVTGANCAFVVLLLSAVDATAGSAGGTIWWDNALLYNQTTTGQTSMPYCELRFPNSPAQLLVSGLVGDIPAPAYVALGGYTLNFSQGSTSYLQFALGRRQRVGAGAALVSPPVGGTGAADAIVLDANSYGGQYTQFAGSTVGVAGSALGGFPAAPDPQTAAMLGVYHIWARAQTANATYGSVAVATIEATEAQQYGSYTDLLVGTQLYGFSAQNTWTTLDAGQASVPVFPRGGLTDTTLSYTLLAPDFYDHAGTPQALSYNWCMLLPVDASLLLSRVIPDLFVTMGNWTWVYVDGSLVNQGGAAASTTSQETTALPAPNDATGGPGAFIAASTAINVNPTADLFATLDPTLATTNASGVNQFAALLTDQSAIVYPVVTEIQYAPLYLTLR